MLQFRLRSAETEKKGVGPITLIKEARRASKGLRCDQEWKRVATSSFSFGLSSRPSSSRIAHLP